MLLLVRNRGYHAREAYVGSTKHYSARHHPKIPFIRKLTSNVISKYLLKNAQSGMILMAKLQHTYCRCAFYGHCDHDIEEVIAGFRMTLTYILRYDPSDEGIAKHVARAMGVPTGPLPPSAGLLL